MKRRLLSFVLAFAMLLSVTPVAVFAADDETGLSLKGTGTETDPYLIEDLDDLKEFRDRVNTYRSDGKNQYRGKYFKLTADIDLNNEEWTPIGTNDVGDHTAFLGTFYGQKADGTIPTISNLHINADGGHLGFFARVGSYDEGITPTVKNITFNNVDVSSNGTNHWDTVHGDYVSGVIANAGGNSVVSGVKVTGDVYVEGCGYVGGIVGHGYPDIDNCHVIANDGSYINGHYWCVGGIIGYAGEGGTPITNSSVSGLDIWSASGGAGAVAGLLNDGNKLENVSASNVEITSNSDYFMGYIAGNGNGSTMTGVTMTNVTATANGAAISATDAVATIGNKIYSNLAGALADVANGVAQGNTIQLVAGTFELGNVKFPATLDNVTIKGADNKRTVIKNSRFMSADGSSVHYSGVTIDGIVFDSSDIVFTGARGGDVTYKDWTITNCEFKNINASGTSAVHFNLASDETIENFTFTNNTMNGVSGSGQSGVRANYLSGNIVVTGNDISNVTHNAIQFINVTANSLVLENNKLASNAQEGIANLYNTTANEISIINNQFLVKEGQMGICYIANVDVSGNYWGGNAPAGLPAGVTCEYYYSTVQENGMLGGRVDIKNYVSLGDSMTNGLGHNGYVNSGYEEYAPTAYPMMFAKKYGFQLKQLATSAARAEDFHYILEVGMPNAYEGDQWTHTEMLGKDSIGINGEPLGGQDRWGSNGVPDAAVVENFRKSVTEADVITLAVGNGNFGVTFMDMTSQIMGLGGYNLDYSYATLENALALNGVDAEITDVVMDTYNRALEYAKQRLPIDKVDVLADRVAYTVASFLINYEGLLDRIIELNPDVEVILVSLVNNMYGFKLDIVQDGTTTTLDMAQFMDGILSPVNAYIAGLAAYKQVSGAYPEATLYYADAYGIETWAQTFDEMYENNKPWCHSRFVSDIRDFIFPMLNAAAGLGLVKITDADVLAYEAAYAAGPEAFAGYAMANPVKAKSIAVYLGLVDAILTALNSTPAVDLGELSVGGGDFATMATPLLRDVFVKFQQNMTDKAAAFPELGELAPLFVTTESLAEAMESNGTLMAFLSVYGRTKLANGLSSHPSVEGHITMFNAIVNAYENGYTAKDETYANIVDAMQFASDYIRVHYNEIYYNAWNLAKAQGFVDMANGYIDQVVAAINSIDYSALDGKTHLIPTLDALKAEVLGDVEALRKLINNQNHPTAGDLTALMDGLYNDLTALQNVAAQADLDAVAQLITLHKQIMKQYDIAYNQACAYVCEQLGQAYDVIVAELTRIVAEQNAAAAELLAKYLGENPADLIQTILEYGYNVDAFINKWSYHAQMLLGPAWNEYGEDITAFVQENIAKLLSSLKAEAGNLSAEATNALLSYIDDLKITENVYAIASQLQNGGMQIGWNTLTELEAIVNGLNDQLIVNAAAAIQALEALAASQDAAAAKAIIDAAIAEIRTTEAERMAAIDAIYANILSAKAALTTAADAINDLQSAAQVLGSLIENPAAFNFDSAVEAITTLLNELDAAVATVKAATAQIVTLTNDVSVTAQAICREAAESKNQVMDALYTAETVLENSGVATETLMRNAYAAAEAYVVGTLNKVNTDMVSLLTLCNTELSNAVNNVVTAVNTCLYNATHGEYEIDRFSKYVALGSNAAYADELAALLGLSDRYVKMALSDNYLADVAGADFVTVKLDNGEFFTFAYNQVMGMAAELINSNASLVNLMKNPYYGATVKEYLTAYVNLDAKAEELNWSAYLDARAQGVLRETLANVKALMLQDGVPEVYAFDIGAILTEMLNEGSDEDYIVVNLVLEIPVADLAVAAIENVLYAYVRFANEFTSVLNTIHAVSPEAEVVVTGIQNPVIGLTLNVAGTEVNVGEYAEYVQYVVDALNLHLYAYALATDNTTYVGGNTAADILNALTVTKAPLLGDANNDGVVDSYDVTLILQYLAEYIGRDDISYAACDVDGDGVVDSYDATLILQYLAEYISFFPAEIR